MVAARGFYKFCCVGNYIEIKAGFDRLKGIHNLKLEAEQDGFFELATVAYTVSFEIDGLEGSYVNVGVSKDMFTDAEVIRICQIGNMRLLVNYPVNERTMSGCVPVGRGSPLAPLLPFKIQNVQDLIQRYEELHDYFASWPKYPPDKGVFVTRDGQKLDYFVELQSPP